jgi:hypothetical protein
MVMVSIRMPQDVVEALKENAPRKGLRGHQALLKAYVGEGLRRDEALYCFGPTQRFAEALRRRGVSDEVITAALKDMAA